MASSSIKMGSGNKGLTVGINLFAMEKYLDTFNSDFARLWITGTVTNVDTKEQRIFNGPGELVTILGKWNVAKFKQLKQLRKNARATKGGGR
jgi:hypothetical protein